jgi:succinate-acetate transporter protein
VPVSVHPQVRVVVRPYGSSIPLGFFAFGIGMFLYAALDAPWVKPTDWHSIGLILACFVAPLELVATVFAFLARDTVAGATLGLFAASWFVRGLLTMQAKPGVLDPGAGYFFVAFAIVALLLGTAAVLGKPLIAALLLISAARTLCSAAFELGAGAGWNRVGGWIALVIFCIAMYGGLAFLLEDLFGHPVLPTGRRGSSREAIEGGLADQLRGLEDEAGVRHTL